MKDDLDRAVAWMKAQDSNATIWLHVEEAKHRIEKLEAALRKIASEECSSLDTVIVAQDALTSTREGLTDYPTDQELDDVVNRTFYRNRPDLRAKNTDSPPPIGEMVK